MFRPFTSLAIACLSTLALAAPTAAGHAHRAAVSPPAVSAAGSTAVVTHVRAAGSRVRPVPGSARQLGTSQQGFNVSDGGQILGLTPAGLHVYVDRGAEHHDVLARETKAAVAAWKSAGLAGTYAGWGTPKVAEGVVTVTVGDAGCVQHHVGTTWQTWQKLASGASYMTSARVVICPHLWDYEQWQWQATIRHELGHAAGLDHFDDTFDGTTQLMRSTNHEGVATFQTGDMNGLKFLASHATTIRKAILPVGRFERAREDGHGTATFTGWSVLKYYLDKPVTITVTDNGKPAAKGVTAVLRTDVNQTWDPNTTHLHGFSVRAPYTSGTHKFCLTASSPLNSAASIDLGCATFS